jgi:hypothetical protein
VEGVIDGLIRKRYLKKQKLSLVMHRDIVRACTEEVLPAPTPALKEASQNPGTPRSSSRRNRHFPASTGSA